MDFRKLTKINIVKSYFLMVTMGLLLIGFINLIAYYTGSTYSVSTITIFASLFAISSTFYSYYNSDKIVLKLTRAQIIDHDSNPQLFNLVSEMAIATGLPMPKIGIIEDQAPNAFATGRDEKHGVVVFTTRILELMDREELQGVVAHELSHIKNRDTLVNAMVTVTAGVIAMISDLILRIFMGRSNRKNNNGAVGAVALLIVAILAPIAAALIQASISRKRESLADVTAAGFTRNPAGLRRALEKLQGDDTVVRARANSVAHLWLENPLPRKKISLFSTHPSLESRIETLKKLEN